MGGFSTYLANKLLDHVLRSVAYAAPAAVYVALHSSDPGETGANEISGGSYVRKALTVAAAVNAATESTALLEWVNMPACVVSHVTIWDAASGGNVLFTPGPLSSAKTIAAGDTFEIAAGDLDAELQ